MEQMPFFCYSNVWIRIPNTGSAFKRMEEKMNNSEIYEKVKKQVLAEAKMMREMNKKIPVSGERIDLPVGGRNVNIVYFRAKREYAPLILGFHGGGFLFGGNAMNDAMWSAVRDALDVNVASVEYRKSPDYQYQAALDDAYDAAVYMRDHAGEFEFDAENISVMGCSAGANLAATVCIYAKKKGNISFKKQILMYPFLDAATDPDSKGAGSLGGPVMYIFNELHCTPEEAKLPVVSPVFAVLEELQGLPEAIFALAENDSLKHEGYEYAKMLEQAGVPVSLREYAKMPHGFFESGFGKISPEEMSFLGEEVLALVQNGEIARVSEEALSFVKGKFL